MQPLCINVVVYIALSLPTLYRYCEHGMLLDRCRSTDPSVDTSMLLTYCRDVALGMHFLSSRHIVHRDLAARNVLLDAAFTCKVSDFGMSATLSVSDGDSDYASNCKYLCAIALTLCVLYSVGARTTCGV